jgi:hypothetical protein
MLLMLMTLAALLLGFAVTGGVVINPALFVLAVAVLVGAMLSTRYRSAA